MPDKPLPDLIGGSGIHHRPRIKCGVTSVHPLIESRVTPKHPLSGSGNPASIIKACSVQHVEYGPLIESGVTSLWNDKTAYCIFFVMPHPDAASMGSP